jgi:hypothetical protein
LVEDELNTYCERGIPILFNPFLANEVINLIRTPMGRQMMAVAGSTLAAESTTTADPV